MRTLFGFGMLLVLVGGVTAADDKIDAKKLLGKWQHTEKKMVVEFLKDGKITVESKDAGMELKATGTYKVEGNKLKLVLKLGDDEHKMTRTVSKLTDTELTSKDDDNGSEDTLKKVKELKEKTDK
jgi:uncharacterized protein (TIGR03066 family)